jgi:hypothetical protein
MGTDPKQIKTDEVTAHFDDILLENVKNFDQIKIFKGKIELNLPTIASLLLVVDKETEIQDCNEADAKRYSRKTILGDLTDIGLEVNDNLIASLQNLVNNKIFLTDAEDNYHPDILAHEVVSNLNRMFPGMPGMNLVAYIIQTIDEVTTGRKDFDEALVQFDKTLKSRGRSLNFVHLRTNKKKAIETEEEKKKRIAQKVESKKISEELKKEYSAKLAQLRNEILSEKVAPEIVTHRKLAAEEVKIKEVSPRKVEEARLRAEQEKLEQEKAELERLEAERLENERIASEKAELERIEAEQLENERLKKEAEEKARLEAEEAKREQIRKEKEELELLRKEKQALEEQKLALERERQRELSEPPANKPLSVEEQIAAFEQELSLSCPLCETGKINTEKTDDNKEYYKCSESNCRFISWSKPFHFKCPVCSNPFLVEFFTPQGQQGLKCPRATCGFSQIGIENPVSKIAPQASTDPGAPKKRRLVRRKKR